MRFFYFTLIRAIQAAGGAGKCFGAGAEYILPMAKRDVDGGNDIRRRSLEIVEPRGGIGRTGVFGGAAGGSDIFFGGGDEPALDDGVDNGLNKLSDVVDRTLPIDIGELRVGFGRTGVFGGAAGGCDSFFGGDETTLDVGVGNGSDNFGDADDGCDNFFGGDETTLDFGVGNGSDSFGDGVDRTLPIDIGESRDVVGLEVGSDDCLPCGIDGVRQFVGGAAADNTFRSSLRIDCSLGGSDNLLDDELFESRRLFQ